LNFSKIVNDSFSIAWRFKTLWIFGLFAAGGGTGFNWPDELPEDLHIPISTWPDINIPSELIVTLLLWLFVIGLFFIICHFISVAALIDGTNRIQRGGVYCWGESFSTGLKHFWRFLGLGLIFFFVFFVGTLGAVLIAIVCFKIHLAIGIFSLLFLIPTGICVIVTGYNIYSLAQRAIVVRDVSIGDSLEEGYTLFRHNIGKNILIFLIELGISIGLGILALMVWALFGIPIAAIVLTLGLGWVAALFLGLLLGLPISLIVGGFSGAVLTNLYTLFYFELLEPTPSQPTFAPPPAYTG